MAATLERATPGMGSAAQAPAAANTYDRAADDVGNMVFLDHINLVIPDQQAATLFYVVGLGFTRDPYMRVGITNMGINVGRSQFHLPTEGRVVRGNPTAKQRLRGTMGFVVSDLGEIAQRLEKVAPQLKDTQFSFKVHPRHVDATCPWGNRFRFHAPSPEFGETELAIAYVEFNVPRGSAEGIARFYREALLALATVEQQGADKVASVTVGPQKLYFHETDAPIPPYDGHHIAVYIANHSGPYRYLKEHNVHVEDSNAHQYRFQDIIDPQTGKALFTLEHEVRSMKHPLYEKPLVNRNTGQVSIFRDRVHDEFRGIY